MSAKRTSEAGSGRSPQWLRRFLRIAAALAAIGFVVVLLLGLAGIFHPKVPESSLEVPAAPLAGRQQAEVRLIKHARFETAAGTVKPVHESEVASKILARVIESDVKAGQAVTKDEVLVRLDDANLQTQLHQMEAAVESANAKMQQAAIEFERVKRLLEQRAAAQAEYDQAAASVTTTTSEVERAKQAVQGAQIVLGYATILAPMSGVVVDTRVEAGDTVSPGQILLTLYDPTRMQLVASVRESLAQRLKVGQTLLASLETMGHDCEATVSEVVPETEAGSRSFSVKVTGPCPAGVYSGMFGRLIIPLDDEEILVVPASAARRVGQLTMVDVVLGDTTRRRNVQLGRRIGDDFEVLSGLRAGEKVILSDQNTIGR